MSTDPGPRFTTADKLAAAVRAIHEVSRRGMPPVAASVTGPALRGLDHPGSDLDVLVAVAPGSLPRPVDLDMLPNSSEAFPDMEITAAPVDDIAARIGVSVPYAEWAASPYLVGVDNGPDWLPFLRSLRPDRYSLAEHARSLAVHAADRLGTRNPDATAKAARQVLATWRFVAGEPGCPIQPRSVFNASHPDAPAAAAWLTDAAQEPGVNSPGVTAVVTRLSR